MPTSPARSSIRVAIQQPALPAYRVPVFAELAKRPGIDLNVVYGDVPDLANATPAGFAATHVATRQFSIGRRVISWHTAQIQLVDPRRVDVLVLSWNLNYASLVPALIYARVRGVRTILWGHGYAKHDRMWRALSRRAVGNLADALLFYDRETARHFADRSDGRDVSRIFVALNTIDQRPIIAAKESVRASPEPVAALRLRYGLVPGATVLFVSRLSPKARLDLLVEAVARIKDRIPQIRVVFIGSGEQASLIDRAAHLGVGDRLLFLGPIYNEQELALWFASADVFCYPASIGLSIIHAMAYGLPVVTSDRRAMQNPEFGALRPGENGELYHDGDPQDLARVLTDLLTDEPKRRAQGLAAAITVTSQYTLGAMVDGFEQAIRYCAELKHRGGKASQ